MVKSLREKLKQVGHAERAHWRECLWKGPGLTVDARLKKAVEEVVPFLFPWIVIWTYFLRYILTELWKGAIQRESSQREGSWPRDEWHCSGKADIRYRPTLHL